MGSALDWYGMEEKYNVLVPISMFLKFEHFFAQNEIHWFK